MSKQRRSSPRGIQFCFALGLAVLVQAAAWANERVGEVEVSVQPLPSKESSPIAAYGRSGTTHGYIEFRVQLKNLSLKDQVVHVRYPGDERFNNINHGVLVSRTVRAAGSMRRSAGATGALLSRERPRAQLPACPDRGNLAERSGSATRPAELDRARRNNHVD